MREYNPMIGYPEPKKPRVVGPSIRTIENRIIASNRGEEYYDGDRNNGYGGFNYDGRWLPIARNMCAEYALNEYSAVLQVGCEKGFLLHDFLDLYPGMEICGTEISQYAIDNAMARIKPFIANAPFTALPVERDSFDLVVAIGVVYTLNLADAIQCLKEVERVSKGASFVTLAAYRTEEEKKLFEWWTVLGAILLHEEEWIRVMENAGYTGDYKFTTSRSLKLVAIEKNQHG